MENYYYQWFLGKDSQDEYPYIDAFLKEREINASIYEDIYKNRFYRVDHNDIPKLDGIGIFYIQGKLKRYPLFPFSSLVPFIKKGEEINWKPIN